MENRGVMCYTRQIFIIDLLGVYNDRVCRETLKLTL